jgi:putative membrane protein
MVYFIINWVVSALSLFALSAVFPGFRVLDFGAALMATGIVGLVSASLGCVLKHVTGPLALATSSAFLFMLNTFLFRLSALLVPGFLMTGFLPALAGALLLLILNLVLLRFVSMRVEAFESLP